MFKIVVLVASIAALTGCASLRGSYEGEHLVIPAIDELKQWQLFQKDEKTYRSSMWQKNGERWANTFAVSIYYKQRNDLKLMRAKMDEPGRSSCQVFKSENLTHPKKWQNEVMFWQTSCEVEGRVVAQMIHLMIQGEESYYHIQKIWKFAVDEHQFMVWKERLESSFVCNKGKTTRPCPD